MHGKLRPFTAALAIAALHLAAAARSQDCQVTIEANDMMQFDHTQLRLPAACPVVELTLRHVGSYPRDVMGHDWVLAKTADMAAIVAAGGAAGLRRDFQPADDPRIIASTKVIGGGESTTIRFPTDGLTPGTEYSFFCTYPGHWSMMQGRLLLEGDDAARRVAHIEERKVQDR